MSRSCPRAGQRDRKILDLWARLKRRAAPFVCGGTPEAYNGCAPCKSSPFEALSRCQPILPGHSFWAGLAAKSLPPAAFEPVGVAFITGSVSAPGLVEAYEHRFPKDHPLRALYMSEAGGKKQPMVDLLLHHGVRACLEYQESGDAERARSASNPDLAPHLSFLDMGGHGYAVLHLTADAVECEFVCIPRPLERSPGADGGPLRYRVVHRVPMWRPGERPRLEQRILEGDPGLAL